MKIYEGMTKDNTALVVIDPINSCAHEKCETPEWNVRFSKVRAMLPRLDAFIKEYREKIGGLIVVTTTTPWTKEHLPENIQELYKDPYVTYYSEDPSGFEEQFNTVEVADTDFILAKNTYDAFSDDGFANKLKEKGIKFIIMTGVFTDACVLATVVGGFSRGYNFVILKDLVETTDDETRQHLQELLLKYTFPKLYGRTVLSNELLEELAK